jgi:transposase InsO family protein
MVRKGVPEHLRSDNGPGFVAKDLRAWLMGTGAKTLYMEPGSPWENGYCESFAIRRIALCEFVSEIFALIRSQIHGRCELSLSRDLLSRIRDIGYWVVLILTLRAA